MFNKFFKRYRIREEYDALLSKTFYYTEKHNWFFGWEPYVINHCYKHTTIDAAKKALIEGGRTVYHYF